MGSCEVQLSREVRTPRNLIKTCILYSRVCVCVCAGDVTTRTVYDVSLFTEFVIKQNVVAN